MSSIAVDPSSDLRWVGTLVYVDYRGKLQTGVHIIDTIEFAIAA